MASIMDIEVALLLATNGHWRAGREGGLLFGYYFALAPSGLESGLTSEDDAARLAVAGHHAVRAALGIGILTDVDYRPGECILRVKPNGQLIRREYRTGRERPYSFD